MDGKKAKIKSPAEAIKHGIAMILQEPTAFQYLSIAENMIAGHMNKSFVDWNSVYIKAGEALKKVGLNMSSKTRMVGISVAEQQLVEIAGSLMTNANIIFMDEPTASLTPDEVNNLLGIIKQLKNEGKTIVYISHRLDEIKEISDTISVLRDGVMVGSFSNAELTKSAMINLMIGRDVRELEESHKNWENVEPFFEVKNISYQDKFRDISFDVHPGEVFGIFGLMGAGRTEVARGIFGVTPITAGEIKINGKTCRIKSPIDAIKAKIALVPEDRQGLGVLVSRPIAFNTTFAVPNKIAKGFIKWINKKVEMSIAEEYVGGLQTKCTSVTQNVGELSGGNQQKVSLAKWLATEPDILILDEPTRGIDVGAKAEVYKLIQELAKKGKCVIMISSELNEILALIDRVMVMYEGKQTDIINRDNMNEMAILSAAHDHKHDHTHGQEEEKAYES